jgi:dihydrofolate reductase
MKNINMIVAMCSNRGIGLNNKIPWYIPEDFKFFKNNTTKIKNSGIVMGKNTWLSLPKKPLKYRENIILSSTLNEDNIKIYDNTKLFNDIESLNEYITKKKEPVWIIGGEYLYNAYINNKHLDKIYITNINVNTKCDVYFPKLPNNFIPIYFSNQKIYNNVKFNHVIFKNNI